MSNKRSKPQKTTHNFAFAAFLILKGYRLVVPPFKDENIVGTEGYAFALDVPFDALESLYAEFEQSDAKKYDSIAKDLRRMIRSMERELH